MNFRVSMFFTPFIQTELGDDNDWEMIMTQAHIFNFFPGSIHSGKILKSLSLFANR